MLNPSLPWEKPWACHPVHQPGAPHMVDELLIPKAHSSSVRPHLPLLGTKMGEMVIEQLEMMESWHTLVKLFSASFFIFSV